LPRYWLTPIISRTPLKLGAERISCDPLTELEGFRSKLHIVHPRLLPMFKAGLLLSDEEEACGTDSGDLDWSTGDNIVFDSNPYTLSHCAEAFLDRLLSADESASLLHVAVQGNWDGGAWTSRQQDWLDACLGWLKQGQEVILLREDGV
jgi:hypothetical protein